jgi:hypothetical protein
LYFIFSPFVFNSHAVQCFQIATICNPEDEAPAALTRNSTNYSMGSATAKIVASEETPMGTGPDLAALFVVQDAFGKSLQDENKNVARTQPSLYPSVSNEFDACLLCACYSVWVWCSCFLFFLSWCQ